MANTLLHSNLFSEVAQAFAKPAKTPGGPRPVSPYHLWVAASKGMEAVEAQTHRHGLRVARLGLHMAERLGYPKPAKAIIALAGLLHDLGLLWAQPRLLGLLPIGLSSEACLQEVSRPLSARRRVLPEAVIETLGLWGTVPEKITHSLGLPEEAIRLAQASLCWRLRHWHAATQEWPAHANDYKLEAAQWLPAAELVALTASLDTIMSQGQGLRQRQTLALEFLHHPETIKRVSRPLLDEALGFFDELSLHPNSSLAQLFTSQLEPKLETEIENLQPIWLRAITGVQLLQGAQALASFAEVAAPAAFASAPGKTLAAPSQQVATMALSLAERLSVSSAQCGEVVLAASLSGYGRLALPIELRHMGTGLNPAERQRLEGWPLLNERALASIPGFEQITLWASEVLERLNGLGLPYHKRGHELSLGGRLIALSYATVALRSPRPYRPCTYTPGEAIALLQREEANAFDKHLLEHVKALLIQEAQDTPKTRLNAQEEAKPFSGKANVLVRQAS